MKFIPNSSIKDTLLKDSGLNNIEDLFLDIPKKIRIKELSISNNLSQQETEQKLRKIAGKNKSYNDNLCFIGGGIKPHYIPSAVKSIVSRSEFFTSYTPYQSEASQGFLQTMFEYQSMIAELTGMDALETDIEYGSLTQAARGV